MKISLLILTIDRFEIAKEVVEKNLLTIGDDFELELLVCDNGSADKRIIDYFATHPLTKYHRVNSSNEGCAKALNQLYLRSTGEIICLFSNDILIPPLWFSEAIRVSGISDKIGLVGVSWGHCNMPPLSTRYDVEAHWLTENVNRVFGTMLFRRDVVEKVGFFPDMYHPYGLEDSSLCERVNRSGYESCYLNDKMFFSEHVVNDCGEKTPYREMKDRSLQLNAKLYDEDVKRWDAGSALYEPLPPMREPI